MRSGQIHKPGCSGIWCRLKPHASGKKRGAHQQACNGVPTNGALQERSQADVCNGIAGDGAVGVKLETDSFVGRNLKYDE